MRILYIHSTLVPPPTDLRTDRFYLLSDQLGGDILQPIWFRTPQEVEDHLGPGSWPVYTVGKFRYHWILSPERDLLSRLAIFLFYLRKGLELHRKNPFDCIVVYSHQTTALFAAILKMLTGAKLIVEIVSTPQLAYIKERPNPGLRSRAPRLYSDICLHISVLMADRCHFLYRGQLNYYRLLRNVPHSVFHEFVPVSAITANTDDGDGSTEPYVLMVGAPWYLKGADILIKAFSEIAPEFPGINLKLLGFYPGQEDLLPLARSSPRTEVLRARPHPEALEIIRRAMLLVAPSRCEGFGRAILEAMAAAKPVIASDVGGIPTLVRDGENGYLFPVGDHRALSARLRQLLGDKKLRQRMGGAGYVRAHSELDENSYVREFTRMVQVTAGATDVGMAGPT